mmetsp:Transcript_45735/g.130548  ORF Transcript_45735/g.130548 Transcript_45735/m.130548 type:complete len:226 (+) Transcript_45735:166-843(+)
MLPQKYFRYQAANSSNVMCPLRSTSTSIQNLSITLAGTSGLSLSGASCCRRSALNSSASIKPLESVSITWKCFQIFSMLTKSIPSFVATSRTGRWSCGTNSSVKKSVKSFTISTSKVLQYHFRNSSKQMVPLPSASMRSHILQTWSLSSSDTGWRMSCAIMGTNSCGSIVPDWFVSNEWKTFISSTQSRTIFPAAFLLLFWSMGTFSTLHSACCLVVAKWSSVSR